MRHARARSKLVLLLLTTQAVMVACVVVGMFQLGAWAQQNREDPSLQQDVPNAPGQRYFPLGGGDSWTVISLHNIEEHPTSPLSVTPERFAGLLSMLVDAGYTAAGEHDVLNLVAGRAVQGRKVLITFDDGAKGLWTYADGLLKKFGLRAMVFVITGRVGTHQPYYLTWRELSIMHASGRWDVESHTHLGHDRILIGPKAAYGEFLANLEWRPDQQRLESIEEYRRRIENDFAASRVEMSRRGLPAPRFFSYPYLARGCPSNDPRIPKLLGSLVSKYFDAAFINDRVAATVSVNQVRDRLLLRREITGGTSVDAVYEKLSQSDSATDDDGRPIITVPGAKTPLSGGIS